MEQGIQTICRIPELKDAGCYFFSILRQAEVCNGTEALEKVKLFEPDLILLDHMMPGLSGKEVSSILKNDPVYKNIPILILSAVDRMEIGDDLKADDHMVKPALLPEILSRIKEMIK